MDPEEISVLTYHFPPTYSKKVCKPNYRLAEGPILLLERLGGPLYEGRMELVAPDERPWNQVLSVCLAMPSRDHQEPGVPAGNDQAREVLRP